MNGVAYERPNSLSEALTLLDRAAGRGRVIAGGTDLILQLRQRVYRPGLLVDITGIEELKQVEENDGWIQIGAAVTHAEVAKNSLIQKGARALAEGCAKVGSPQIRNMATLVGNVISAQPAADGAIPLTALEAEIKVVSKAGERWVSMEEMYRAVGVSSVDASNELAMMVRFQKIRGRGQSRFFRVCRRKALSLPILNGAVVVLLNSSSNRIQEARIALGPVAEKPFRARRAEAYLQSKETSSENILVAARIAAGEANARTSLLRGSEVYRREMIRVYLERTLQDLLRE